MSSQTVLTPQESRLTHASMHRTTRSRNDTGFMYSRRERDRAVARERLLQTRTMHALNTRDIRTGFLSSQAQHTCNASAQEEGGRQRPTRTTRHTHAHRPDIPHDTRTELLAAAPPPSSQPAPPTPTEPTPPPVQASAHKDSPSYNLPGAAAPVHSSGLEKTAVECVTLRISLF